MAITIFVEYVRNGIGDNGVTLSSTAFSFATPITEDITLYAKWYPKWASEVWTISGTGVLGGTFNTDPAQFVYNESNNTFVINSIDLVANSGGIKFRQNNLSSRWANAAGGVANSLDYNAASANISIDVSGTYKVTFDIEKGKYSLDKIGDIVPNAQVISFNTQGGSVVPTYVAVKSGITTDISSLVGTVSRGGGYNFGGWYTSDDNGTTYKAPEYNLNSINTTNV